MEDTKKVKNNSDIYDESGLSGLDNIDFTKLGINDIIRICLKCNTEEDAKRILERYEKYFDTPEMAHDNLGYIFGYCDPEDRKKLYALFSVDHPAFGHGFGRGSDPSIEEAFKIGKKLGEEIRKGAKK